MASRKIYSALSKQVVKIPARSVATVDYLDSKPNHYRIQNRGTSPIYASVSSVPTTANYDFMIRGESMQMYAEPFFRDKLYIYNPSGSEISCLVTTFQAEFNPLTLTLSGIEIAIPDEITSTSVISAFNCALPLGNNKIGSVDVLNQKDYTAKLSEIITAIGGISGGSSAWTEQQAVEVVNGIAQVNTNLAQVNTNLATAITKLTEISGKLTNAEGVGY